LLEKAFRRLQRLESDALIPGAEPDALFAELSAYAADRAVAVVGHEPHLSGWVSWCLTGSLEPLIELRKGAACLLRFDDGLGRGRARLLWLVTPGILRRL
jgi:phosphohistidine phosphatase